MGNIIGSDHTSMAFGSNIINSLNPRILQNIFFRFLTLAILEAAFLRSLLSALIDQNRTLSTNSYSG